MKELELVTELRKAPVTPAHHRVWVRGPVKLEQESSLDSYPEDATGELYRIGALFTGQFALTSSQSEARELAHKNLVRAIAGSLFAELWGETFEIERLLHEAGVTWRVDEPGYEILQRLNAIREATGYRL